MTPEAIQKQYETETGRTWDDYEGKVWLAANRDRFDPYCKEPRLAKLFHLDLSDKLSWLSQLHCPICKPDFPVHTIPVRIEPRSFQCIDSVDRSAFKLAVRDRMASSNISMATHARLCVHLVFSCSVSRTAKDLDNMAKLFIDAIKGVIMGDDVHIDHLSIVRLEHEESEESIFLRISNSNLNTHNDVVARVFNHEWGGFDPIILANFYPKS